METYHPPKEVEEKKDNSDLPEKEIISEKWLVEKIDSLLPLIKEKHIKVYLHFIYLLCSARRFC